METVSFRKSREFQKEADSLFSEQKERIEAALSSVDVQHVGSTPVPHSLTKGDLDINVRVEEEKFNSSIKILKRLYQVAQPENWTDTFASFKDKSLNPILGVQLTVKNSSEDHFVKHRDAFLSSSDLVEKYNKLKKDFDGKSMNDYRKAKAEFLKKIK